MTRFRVWFWAVGLLTVAALSSLVPWGVDFHDSAPLGLLLILGMIGLAIEVVLAIGTVRAAPRDRAPAGARPADGRVDLMTVAGARTEPNARDPRFGRFLELVSGPTTGSSEPARPRENPALLGRIAILSMFVGRDGRGWSDAEIDDVHTALVRAGTWIEREAIRWGAPVNIALADTDFVTEDEASEEVTIEFTSDGGREGPFETGATVRALAGFSRASARLGFADAEDLTSRIRPRVEADVLVWLLHQRRAGRSFAVPPGETELPGVTLAVCFARETSLPERLTRRPYADPITYVHELLHLFGAEDKYDVPLGSFPERSVTERDVMRLDETSLSRMRIDPRTAAEIGWSSSRRGP